MHHITCQWQIPDYQTNPIDYSEAALGAIQHPTPTLVCVIPVFILFYGAAFYQQQLKYKSKIMSSFPIYPIYVCTKLIYNKLYVDANKSVPIIKRIVFSIRYAFRIYPSKTSKMGKTIRRKRIHEQSRIFYKTDAMRDESEDEINWGKIKIARSLGPNIKHAQHCQLLNHFEVW